MDTPTPLYIVLKSCYKYFFWLITINLSLYIESSSFIQTHPTTYKTCVK